MKRAWWTLLRDSISCLDKVKCVINGNILSMCVLPVVLYDAAKRIAKLSSIVPLLIGEVNDHFTSEGHNTCSLVVIA